MAGHEAALERLLERVRDRIAPRIMPEQLEAAIDQGALVIDTRTSEQRRLDGDIEGAVVIERNVLEWRLDPHGEYRIEAAKDPDRTVIVVCDEGYASSLAAASLLDIGRRNVTDLEGGFQALRRYRAAGA